MEIKLNRDKLEKILEDTGLSKKDLYDVIQARYDFPIGYKAFHKLLINSVSWKLSYAQAICETLETSIMELFDWGKEND